MPGACDDVQSGREPHLRSTHPRHGLIFDMDDSRFHFLR